MEADKQRKLDKLEWHFTNLERLLEASKIFHGSTVSNLNLDRIISHLTSQLNVVIADTKLEGTDSIIFLFSRLANIRKGLQRPGFDLKDLDALIDIVVAEMCKMNGIKSWKVYTFKGSRSALPGHSLT